MNFILDRKAFIYVLTRFLHLSFDSSLDMVMSFYGIALSLMTLLITLISFLRYVGTLFMVMFLHKDHAFLLHHDY